MVNCYSISVKGVVSVHGRYLLRKNQREEFELLGGRLERSDISFETRLQSEFIEESGVTVQVNRFLEPWIYVIGSQSVLIAPFLCSLIDIPDTLIDMDGGALAWVPASSLASIPMPAGYLDSIQDRIPRLSRSANEGKYFKIYDNYHEDQFDVRVSLRGTDGSILYESSLPLETSPREVLGLGSSAAVAKPPSRASDRVVLNYELVGS